jgi:hypothetical protein
MNTYTEYRDGGEGLVRWAEENIRVPIYPEGQSFPVWVDLKDLPVTPNPETGRSYREMWVRQKALLIEALEMEDGRFKHALAIFCWPRGEGKSFLVVITVLWLFFCWPRQRIVLCANSKDQVQFVHYEIIKDTVRHSPKLLRLIGEKNIHDKEMRFKDSQGRINSKISSVSTFSGIFSNITCYTFSEFFDLKQPKFFEQMDGNIRNVPNAIGLIDTTVSGRGHILYSLFEAHRKGLDPRLYFSYRYSEGGDYRDYWHPNNTQVQLDSYKVKFALGGFDRYFKNLWTAGTEKVFRPVLVEAMQYLGVGAQINAQGHLIELLDRRRRVLEGQANAEAGVPGPAYPQDVEIADTERELWHIEDEYRIKHDRAPLAALDRLSEIYDTDWAVMVGMDRGQPMKRRTLARTIITVVAKGLPGSRSDDRSWRSEVIEATNSKNPELAVKGPGYIYFVLRVADIEDHSLEGIKGEIKAAHAEYQGIDSMCSETWGVWDMVKWVEDLEIKIEVIAPMYSRQLSAFTELYNLVKEGRIKAPPCGIMGSKGGDLLVEELEIFDHNTEKKWFGSPEKKLKYGVQDDAVYSLGWTIYGGRYLNPDDFKPRNETPFWGTMIQPTGLVGAW